MGCSCSVPARPPAAAEQEIQAVVELFIGPELTADELTTLRDEKLQPLLDKYGHWPAQGHLEAEVALLEARIDEIELQFMAKMGSHNLSVMIAYLKKQLNLKGLMAPVVDQACALLGLPTQGSLVEKATTCYTLVAGEEKAKALVTHSRKYSSELR